jgi:probable O-glycosylation ligase (exosortase A-associated)
VRDLVVFLLFVGLLPLCFLRPWFGLMTFTWLAYNRTQDLTWGFARGLPISQTVAIAMIAGWLIWEPRPLMRNDNRLKAMVLLLIVVGFSIGLNRLRWDYQGSRYQELIKIILVSLLTSALCINRGRLRGVMFVIAGALGFFGVKNALWFMMGQQTGIGPGGMLKDNNDFALAMVMNLPLLWYLSEEAGRMRFGRFARPAMRVAFFMTMLTIMATGSRGGFLSMGVTLVAMALKTRWKIPAIVGMGLLGALGLMMAPAEYIERLGTITDAKDASVIGRLVSWKVAFEMIKDKPLLGIGFKNMVFDYQMYLARVQIPAAWGEIPSRVAHNSYLQVWAETGTIAFGAFMFMILSTILLARRIARTVRRTADAWVVPYANSIEVTFYGFLTGALFLNRAHFDLIYQLVAVAAAVPAVIVAERAVIARKTRRKGPAPARHVEVGHRDPFVRPAP